MIPTLVRRSAVASKVPFNVHTNPYKAQKIWPPDFKKLPPKHQFRLERRYKRRAKLKWARPTWTKAVKLAQWGSAGFVLIYGVLFMDWGRDDTPFKGVREWYKGLADSIWTTGSTQAARAESQARQPPLRNP